MAAAGTGVAGGGDGETGGGAVAPPGSDAAGAEVDIGKIVADSLRVFFKREEVGEDGTVHEEYQETLTKRQLGRALLRRGSNFFSPQKGEYEDGDGNDQQLPGLLMLMKPRHYQEALEAMNATGEGSAISFEAFKNFCVGGVPVMTQVSSARKAPSNPSSIVSQEAEQTIRNVFQLLDKDGSGSLEKREFIRAMRLSNHPEFKEATKVFPRLTMLLKPRAYEKAFLAMDSQKTGHVSYPEFRSFCVSTLVESLLREVFDAIDTDGSGTLEKREILRSVQSGKAMSVLSGAIQSFPALKKLLKPQSYRTTFQTMDTGNTGHVTFEEFHLFCTSTIIEKELGDIFDSLGAGGAGTLEKKAVLSRLRQGPTPTLLGAIGKFPSLDLLLRPAQYTDALAGFGTAQPGTLTKAEFVQFFGARQAQTFMALGRITCWSKKSRTLRKSRRTRTLGRRKGRVQRRAVRTPPRVTRSGGSKPWKWNLPRASTTGAQRQWKRSTKSSPASTMHSGTGARAR